MLITEKLIASNMDKKKSMRPNLGPGLIWLR